MTDETAKHVEFLREWQKWQVFSEPNQNKFFAAADHMEQLKQELAEAQERATQDWCTLENLVERYKRERDEAQHEAGKWKDVFKFQRDAAETFKQERDEAHRARQIIKDTLMNSLEIMQRERDEARTRLAARTSVLMEEIRAARIELEEARADIAFARKAGDWEFSSRPLHMDIADLVKERDEALRKLEDTRNDLAATVYACDGLKAELEEARADVTVAEVNSQHFQCESIRLHKAIEDAHNHLVDLQPHIPIACYPKHEQFIDNHVDCAMEVLEKALKHE